MSNAFSVAAERITWLLSSFINVVYHIDFMYVESFLESWDESNMVMLYDFFLYVVGFQFASIMLRIFVSLFIKDNGL